MAKAASAGAKMGGKFLTLSFSGAGHLLPYHLGVASSIHRSFRRRFDRLTTNQKTTSKCKEEVPPPIKAVSGSSSGAIAATVFARLPHRIDEYADRFLKDGGGAVRHLTEMMHDEERRGGPSSSSSNSAAAEVIAEGGRGRGGNCGPAAAGRTPSLHIATTRCSDGRLRLFSFPAVSSTFRTISSSWTTDDVLRAVRASCRIPPTFHPADVLEPWWWGGGGPAAYPEADGVAIGGAAYVDGGIAAPAPPTPHDGEDGAVRLIVSPISGSVPIVSVGTDEPSGTSVRRISPADDTLGLLPFELKCRGDFRVRPSVQNLRALMASAGAASAEELRGWYERGLEDGKKILAGGLS